MNAQAESTSLNEQTEELQISPNLYVYEPETDISAAPISVPSNAPYKYEVKSQSDQMSKYLQKFSNKIKSMFLTIENTDQVFHLSIGLIEEFTKFYQNLQSDKRDYKDDMLNLALEFVREKLLENSSSYKRHQKVVQNELYVAPQEKALGTHWEMVREDSNLYIPRLLQSKFHYIPIIGTVRALFNQKEFREMYFQQYTSEDRHTCLDGIYKHFCCGSRYKNCELFESQPHALQFHIATDDYDNCVALGSKSGIHKMCPIYFTIKNAPNKFSSKLSNIHLISLCRSDDIKTMETDFNDLWEHIVCEMREIEENGINIDSYTNIKGTISYLGFDNLGANTTLGLVESFISYFCRFCVASKKETQTMTEEDPTMLRTIDSYESHLRIVNESEKVDFAETKGVKRGCALNKLKYFHILKNKSVDIMHDLNEGLIPFLLKNLFSYGISKKVFTEDWLKKQIQFFNYSSFNKNVPSQLQMRKENLNQNASQLMCLFRNIGFIFYSMRENEIIKHVWVCVETLQKIVQICYSTELREIDIQLLNAKITEHLTYILEILHLQLLPKHHLVTHYPNICREMGPPVYMNMLRFEAKHKALKTIAKRGNNYINITKTISVRHQAELIYNGFTYCDEIDCGKITRRNIEDFNLQEKEIVSEILLKDDILCEIQWFKINNFTFKKELAILHEKHFHEIDKILIIDDKYYLLCICLEFKKFDSFTHSLIVEKIVPLKVTLIPFNKLKFVKPYEIKHFDQKLFIFADTLDVEHVM